MKVCLILEGSYPYVHGGVSSWTQNFIKNQPDHEFVLWVIGAHERDRGNFVYELPSNIVEIHEVFLDSPLLHMANRRSRAITLPDTQANALGHLFMGDNPDWRTLIDLFQSGANSQDVLMSRVFFEMVTKLCREKYPHLPFSKTFHTSRSMLLPVFYLLGQDIPEADMYHTVCTGYGGMLGAMAHVVTGKPLVLTEHGIYSREREEELIRADWVESVFKRRWIQFFYMLSNFCYDNSTVITSLFDSARAIQIELGAPPDKCQVIRNGVDYNAFAQVPEKTPRGKIVIGAVIRLARIKDVKTMIYAFYELTKRYGAHGVELHILGDTDDEEYAHECHQLVADLGLRNLFFDGHQNTLEFMEKFDFTILSSISEGQPLCLLESMAAARPVVCTDVGSCRELVQGANGDNLGPAGICVAPMDRIALTDAMDTLCSNTGLRRQMGLVGQKRVSSFYRTDIMMDHYRLVYDETMKMLESESPRSLGSHDVGEED